MRTKKCERVVTWASGLARQPEQVEGPLSAPKLEVVVSDAISVVETSIVSLGWSIFWRVLLVTTIGKVGLKLLAPDARRDAPWAIEMSDAGLSDQVFLVLLFA